MKRSNALKKLTLLALLGLSSLLAHAQDVKAIKIVVGFPAGGAPDAIARAFADQMRMTTGAAVTIENRTGASGKLAIDHIAASAADGQTVMLMPTNVLVMLPMVSNSAKFDVNKDFVALGSLAEYGFGIAAGPISGATDLKSYMAWAQANPAKNNYATPGLGTPQHFIGAEMAKLVGGDKGGEMNHVPYRGGAPALTDLLGGQIPLLITTEQLLVPHHAQGKLTTLFVTSRTRNAKMPNVPTAKEVGLPKLEAMDWFGLFAKAGTPAAKIDEWRGIIAKVVSTNGYQTNLTGMGYSVPKTQLTDYKPSIELDKTAWADRVRVSGFKATE